MSPKIGGSKDYITAAFLLAYANPQNHMRVPRLGASGCEMPNLVS